MSRYGFLFIASAAADISVQPWAANSMRVQVTPPPSLLSWLPVAEPASPATCAKGEENTDQVGGLTLKAFVSKSNDECCARCLGMPQCSVWVRDSNQTCHLVQGYTGKRSVSDRTAGFVRPSGPPPGALVPDAAGDAVPLQAGRYVDHGNIRARANSSGSITFSRKDTGATLFSAMPTFSTSQYDGYLAVELYLQAGNSNERIFGLGQGNWTEAAHWCACGAEKVVPLLRNGQHLYLQQSKFQISIPFVYSSAGYGFLFNMQGYGSVAVGAVGVGGMLWRADAALGLDFWVSTLPADALASAAEPIYTQYADATGHAPALREDAMLFWQSRNRYKSTAIALDVADRYAQLNLPVGVLVVDYKNQKHDGDFAPDATCYPSVKDLAAGVRQKLNATTSFSFWPEVMSDSDEFGTLTDAGCLINPALSGLIVDPTTKKCRDLIWDQFLKPRYVDQGVSFFWLDETDGEGTACRSVGISRHCQYQGVYSAHGYDTSYGPAHHASNAWVNRWIQMFTEPVAAQGELPLVLTRAVWAGGQRHGIVLWSSDIESTFEELTAQVNLGVHSSLSGIPWWTSDVGGYTSSHLNESPYMKELMVRWYQFGCFSPIFRAHGCRRDPDPDADAGTCHPAQHSCGPNEVWSYGNDTQVMLEKYIRLRATLKPYIAELAANVTARGVPTARPLWWEFPNDTDAADIDDQYLLGPDLLVAPVTVQGATSRHVYFPVGASWQNFFDDSDIVTGGTAMTVQAPLDIIPVYKRVQGAGRLATLV